VIDAKGACYKHNRLAFAKPHDLNHERASYVRAMQQVLVISTIGLPLQAA
jgi:hypothetical protein